MKTINLILCIACIGLLAIFTDCSNKPISNVETFDGNLVSFDMLGKGEPTIIFIHGWSNTRAIWEEQITHFSEKHKVIAVDLPGYGQSGNTRENWTMENFGKDISAIITQLKLDDVVLVGFSMGAPVAIETARQMPDNVEGVVLVDNIQQIEMQIPPPMMHFMDSAFMDLVNNPTKEKLLVLGFFKHNAESSTQKVIDMVDGVPKIGWSESLLAYMDWQNNKSTSSVHAVKAPIIAINSDTQPTNVEAFRKYAPSFKAKIVKDVAHVIMWDNPEEFNRLLEESIQEFSKE